MRVLVVLVLLGGIAHAATTDVADAAKRGDRDAVRAALEAMGLPVDARAETLAPEQWRDLYGRLA